MAARQDSAPGAATAPACSAGAQIRVITRCGRCRFDDSAGPRNGCGTRVVVRFASVMRSARVGAWFAALTYAPVTVTARHFFGLGGAMRAHFARTRCGRRIQFNTVLPSAAMARSTIATRWIVSSPEQARLFDDGPVDRPHVADRAGRGSLMQHSKTAARRRFQRGSRYRIIVADGGCGGYRPLGWWATSTRPPGDKLERLIDGSSKRLEGKIDILSVGLTEVQKGVAHIDGAMPHIETRLSNLERQ